jgi:hypothetical protein
MAQQLVKGRWAVIVGITLLWTGAGVAHAGSLEPTAAPGPTMKTLDQIPPTWSQKLDSAHRFELVYDGHGVLDKETGLVWEQSPVPQVGTIFWEDAITLCVQRVISNRYGWRLPTIEELASLIDTSTGIPVLPSPTPFSGLVSGAHYWSISTYVPDPNSAWYVNFGSGGGPHAQDKHDFTFSGSPWCVRGPGA